jgi:hypothetical protein
MHHGVWLNGDDEKSWMDDTEITRVERVRGKTRLAKNAPKRRHQPDPTPLPAMPVAFSEDESESLERVGRRHFVRPELGAIVVGAVFILAALVKPWGTVAPAPSPSASAPASDAPILAVQGSQEPPLPPYLVDMSRVWSGVDWSFLRLTDMHVGWGIATASMAEVITSAPRPTPREPSVVWTPVPTATPTVLDVGPNVDVFALAITWPTDVSVTDITVEYMGSGYDPPSSTAGGFIPYTQLSPLSADAVLASAAQPSASPPHSGQFWVPPAVTSSVTANHSAATAWHLLPWPWPLGDYELTIKSPQQQTALSILLRLTPGTPST